MTDELVKRLYARAHQGIAATPFNLLMDAKERIEALTAERDRLRKELEAIANDYEAGYPLSHDAIKYAARAALKGAKP